MADRWDWQLSLGGGKSDVLAANQTYSFLGHLGQSSCQSDEFLCGNGKCLPRSWKCNGQDECGDASDERSCLPTPTEAQPGLCPSGSLPCTEAQSTRCLPAGLRCNGARDCHDGSDELGCPDTTCGKRLGNFYGSFASPDFFRANRSGDTELRCSWLLDTQDPKPIVLQLDLQLGPGDLLHVYDGLLQRAEHLLQVLSYHNNRRPALLESSRGQMSVLYMAQPHSPGHGFNATYQVLRLANVHFIHRLFSSILCNIWQIKSFKQLLKKEVEKISVFFLLDLF